MLGCGFQVRTETEAARFKLVAEHAKTVHELETVLSDMATNVKSVIRKVLVEV